MIHEKKQIVTIFQGPQLEFRATYIIRVWAHMDVTEINNLTGVPRFVVIVVGYSISIRNGVRDLVILIWEYLNRTHTVFTLSKVTFWTQWPRFSDTVFSKHALYEEAFLLPVTCTQLKWILFLLPEAWIMKTKILTKRNLIQGLCFNLQTATSFTQNTEPLQL